MFDPLENFWSLSLNVEHHSINNMILLPFLQRIGLNSCQEPCPNLALPLAWDGPLSLNSVLPSYLDKMKE